MCFGGPDIPPPPPPARPTFNDTRQQGELATRIARIRQGERVTRESLIIDPAISIPGATDALNVPR